MQRVYGWLVQLLKINLNFCVEITENCNAL